jgi:hypothetical protein
LPLFEPETFLPFGCLLLESVQTIEMLMFTPVTDYDRAILRDFDHPRLRECFQCQPHHVNLAVLVCERTSTGALLIMNQPVNDNGLADFAMFSSVLVLIIGGGLLIGCHAS